MCAHSDETEVDHLEVYARWKFVAIFKKAMKFNELWELKILRAFFKVELVEIVGDLQPRLSAEYIHTAPSDGN